MPKNETPVGSRNRRSPKRPYRKPLLRMIELAGDEVLGTGCKTMTGTGRDGLCQGPPAPCSDPGT